MASCTGNYYTAAFANTMGLKRSAALLSREFHYGPDPSNDIEPDPHTGKGTSPPESKFKELGPSKHRYTLLEKDEL